MRIAARLCAIAAGALAVSACAVGPRYQAPSTPATASQPFVSTQAGVAEDQPLPANWWRLYQDPVLDGLVQQALAENQDLKVAASNLAYAQALVEEAKAGRYPSTDLSAGANYGKSAQEAAAGANAHWTYSAGFTAAYQVDLFGKIRRTIEAARANAEASRSAEDAVRVTVAAETASAYASVCGLGEQLSVARRSVDLVQQAYDITVRQRDAGALSDFDVAREGVLLQQARAAVGPLEGQRRAALFTLAALVGKTPAEAPVAAQTCATPPKLAQALPVGDGAALLQRRPDIREAERTLASQTARIGVATSEYFPSVSLGGSVSSAAGGVGQLFSAATTAYTGGPLVTWSFPNVTLAHAHVAEARAQAEGALASFDSVVLQALKETEQALSTYAAELDHHAALSLARQHAAEALRLAQIQYQAGSASFLDLITAQQTLVSADQQLAASDQAISADQVAVFQALGGGWEQAPPVSPPKLPGR
ncbi:efflux transporter outer membrane subunit [Caulobacter sp. KR2-114]|uniref:efflux transporter outer membrane subunit n=1 Tax=Caulobacter sp. KR2-114 TaxID=3400912 RepID=UPI003BFF1FD0